MIGDTLPGPEHRQKWLDLAQAARVDQDAFEPVYQRLLTAEDEWRRRGSPPNDAVLWRCRANLAVADTEREALVDRALVAAPPGGAATFDQEAARARLSGVPAGVVERAIAKFQEVLDAAQEKAAAINDDTSQGAQLRRHLLNDAVVRVSTTLINRMLEGRLPPEHPGHDLLGLRMHFGNARPPDLRYDDFVEVPGGGRAWRMVATEDLGMDVAATDGALSSADRQTRITVAAVLDLERSPQLAASLVPFDLFGRTDIDPFTVADAARMWICHEDVLRQRAPRRGVAGPAREALRLADPLRYAARSPAEESRVGKRIERALPAVALAARYAAHRAGTAEPPEMRRVLHHVEIYYSMAVLEALGPYLHAPRPVGQVAAGLAVAADAAEPLLELSDEVRRPPGGPAWTANCWQDLVDATRTVRRRLTEPDADTAAALDRLAAQLDHFRAWVTSTFCHYLRSIAARSERAGDALGLATAVKNVGAVERAAGVAGLSEFLDDLDGAIKSLSGYASSTT